MITSSQRFTAEVYINLPEGVVVLSPAAFTGDGTRRYRLVADSSESVDDAREKLLLAAKQISLDVNE